MSKKNRRDFIKLIGLTGIGLGWNNKDVQLTSAMISELKTIRPNGEPDIPFVPNRVASWWCTIEDLQYPQKKITDKIKKRAAAFADARIDTAINFGFHVRFDFSNYFGQLHAYYANVCEELHKYNIKFLDHYSCNHVERPRGEVEIIRLNNYQRHHTLLYHDPVAANYAQYEGHFFNDLCEVDLKDGSRGYSPAYQFEIFCHNNPGFLDMHRKYLERLMREVPMDGIEVDDMCDYGGPATCGCTWCRQRFKKDYGHAIPPYSDQSFWGDTQQKNKLLWGNYENPAFRDWIKMRADSVADHLKMVKRIIGSKPLMTCCSSTGPIVLNMVALNLEKMAPHLDLFMLENVGSNVNSVNWIGMDAEAMQQKDIAEKRGGAPAMALCYCNYPAAGYLGWGLSRFWGVARWTSTGSQGIIEDPADEMEVEEIIHPYNNWEIKHSDLDYRNGVDVAEVRLVSNSYCRDNGWRDEQGKEHWDRVLAWSTHLLQSNIGYRIVRAEELADASLLLKETTPLVLDGVAAVSDKQFAAIISFLSKGGKVWMAFPFGTHDEKGFKRKLPLSDQLLKIHAKNIIVTETAIKTNTLKNLIERRKFKPALIQTAGDNRWAARIRIHKNKTVIHFMNTAIKAIPHPTLEDATGAFILKDVDTYIKNNQLQYEIDTKKIPLSSLEIASPETGTEKRQAQITRKNNHTATLHINLEGIKVYALAQ